MHSQDTSNRFVLFRRTLPAVMHRTALIGLSSKSDGSIVSLCITALWHWLSCYPTHVDRSCVKTLTATVLRKPSFVLKGNGFLLISP